MTQHSRFTAVTLCAAALALVLAACGSDSGGQEAGSDSELTPVTVGGLPIIASVGIQYGIEHGIFEEHGLDVTLEMSQSGAALIPSVVSGDYDFGGSNTVSIMVALDTGMPIQVTSGLINALAEGEDISGVFTLPGSDIQTAADLEGRTVAVNALNSVGPLTIREIVRRDGGDPDAVEFVEINYPEMEAALDAGHVDAVWEVEPFVTRLDESGADLLFYNFQELAPGVPTMVMIAGVDQDPELVEQFNTAFDDVLSQAWDDQDGLRAIIPDFLGMDPELAEVVRLDRFDAQIDTGPVQVLADLAYSDGLVSNPVDVSQFEN